MVVSVSVEDRGVLLRKVPPGQKPWMRWRGALKGSGALEELEREHRQEVDRDEALTKKRNAKGT